jgi:NAD-dependent oxidoreductase involved in siderophore biosynthesis
MSRIHKERPWAGCHGVRVEGEPVGVGSAFGTPLATATVKFGPLEEAEGTVLWVQHGEAGPSDDRRIVDRVLARRPDGRLLLSGSDGPVVEVDQSTATITIDSKDDVVHRQLLAAFGLPLILNDVGALMVHGSACALGDETILVCGESGSGKSSTLVRLVDAGWLAVSEDVCAIDLNAPGGPVVWPGPPWVRIGRDERGPRGCDALFEQIDKTAWDISHVQTTEAKRLSRIVLLDAPGGVAPQLRQLTRADAIRTLARHAVWLEEQDERGRRLFELVTALAARVPAFRMQLPRNDRWTENLPDLLATSMLIS